MKFLHHAYCKKLSASFFLALFVFIHAVKAFHTHDASVVTVTNNNNKKSTTVTSFFYCAICDFQIAKDSDAETAAIDISTPVHIVASFYSYVIPAITTSSFVFSVRGPPVISA